MSVQILTDQITRQEAVIADLEDQIAQLDTQIADTQARIDVEKEQVAAMARAIYRQPDSLWLLVARTGNIREALQATADLVVAGQRAHALQARLEADLLKLQKDRSRCTASRPRSRELKQGSSRGEPQHLNDLMSQQSDISDQLAEVITQIQTAQNGLQDQAPDVTAALAALLESQEQDLIQQSNQLAWSAAHVGAGLALVTHMLPSGKTIAGPDADLADERSPGDAAVRSEHALAGTAARPVQAFPHRTRHCGVFWHDRDGGGRRGDRRGGPFRNGLRQLRDRRARRRDHDPVRPPARDRRQCWEPGGRAVSGSGSRDRPDGRPAPTCTSSCG